MRAKNLRLLKGDVLERCPGCKRRLSSRGNIYKKLNPRESLTQAPAFPLLFICHAAGHVKRIGFTAPPKQAVPEMTSTEAVALDEES